MPDPRTPARTYALALTPYALVGLGVVAALVGLGCAAVSAAGAGAVVAGSMAWLDLRSPGK